MTTNQNTLPQQLTYDLLKIAAEILEIPSLTLSDNLEDNGMDSINTSELAIKIEDQFGISTESGVFFDLPTINAIADYLWTEYQSAIAAHYKL
ncbi:acyl carrier protein [bacterium]|nr:acyl carrier protein [bacterium]